MADVPIAGSNHAFPYFEICQSNIGTLRDLAPSQMRREEPQDTPNTERPAPPPPAYDGQNGGARTQGSSNTNQFVSIPTNYLSITDVNAISGRWTIDTSWTPPPNVFGTSLSPIIDNERQNLFLRSEHGAIRAKIRLVGDHQETALFNLETKRSEINVSVVSRGKQPFVLNVTSSGGNLRITVPRNFDGSIIHEATSSSYTSFSKEMEPNLVTVSMVHGNGKTLLRRSNGDQKRQSIRGDQIVAKTEGGYIRFAYEDEPELPPIAMFFKNLFGSA